MGKSIIVAERDNIAAVMENGRVAEFYVHRGEILLGDIYISKVMNVLPSIEAAFVDVGSDKMGFLHADDAIGKGRLQDKLKPKQNLLVQVIKEPTGHKGPRVTTQISLPGRFLVLMPSEVGINVSKKITSSKERARLKSIISLLKPVGVGVIVRTEAEGQPESELQEDMEILLEKWNSIITAAEEQEAPNLLYRDQDLLYRVIREACSDDTSSIMVDTAFALQRAQQLLQNWNMSKRIDVTLYKGSEPMLVSTGIAKEIKQALGIKVNLPCGGYLYVQTTEALTVVDVNSGKFISSSSQEETILKTNLEAVDEIARQLRLRNIGGMVIIDFIDMLSRTDKIAVMERLELALENDKAKPQVGQLSDLGLVELTRHRQGQSISEMFSKTCPHCQGTGYIIQDFNFASSTADAEYRSKAAKAKIPTGQFNPKKKFNKFNKNNQENAVDKRENGLSQPAEEENIETVQNIEVTEQVQEIEKPVEIPTAENMQNLPEENGKKYKKNKKFSKNKETKVVKEETAAPSEETMKEETSNPEAEEAVETKEEKKKKTPKKTTKKSTTKTTKKSTKKDTTPDNEGNENK